MFSKKKSRQNALLLGNACWGSSPDLSLLPNFCPQKRSDVSDLICLVNQLYYEIKESTLEIRSLTFCGAVVAEE